MIVSKQNKQHRRLFNYRQLLCQPSTMQWVQRYNIIAPHSHRTHSHIVHKWLWLHLSALYTVNKGIPILNCNVFLPVRAGMRACVCDLFSFVSFGCLIIHRLNYDLFFYPFQFYLSHGPMSRYSMYVCHLYRSVNRREEKLKSSMARLLKLTTYWNPLCVCVCVYRTLIIEHAPSSPHSNISQII